jgi:large subunit ribosomal protein L25
MLNLSAKIRNPEKKSSEVIEEGKISGILYGPKIENKILEIDQKLFEKAYEESGLSSLINLEVDGKGIPVLIHDFQRDPLTNNFIHVDFYQPNLEEKIETKVPLIFEGQSKAVKDLEGTLIKHIQELEIKAVPHKLPREIKVDIGRMDSFEDIIEVKDLNIPEDVEVLREPDEIIVSVSAPEDVDEELSKPVEEETVAPTEEEKEGEEKEEEEESKEEKEEKEEENK